MSTALLSQAVPLLAGGTFWLPPKASVTADFVDGTFYLILYTTSAFFIAIVFAMAKFARDYKMRGPGDRTSPLAGSHMLELFWSAIPAIGLFTFFWFGFVGYTKLQVVPSGAMEIRATGQKWYWTFSYPEHGGFDVSTNPALVEAAAAEGKELALVVPINEPVKLIGSSVDVLHSMFIPAFRTKKDVMSNRYTVLWFQATQEGVFDFFCTEYCGTDHSRMRTKVIVKSRPDFDKWVAEMSADSAKPIEGPDVYAKYGCNACHSIDGSKLVGPSFKGLQAKGTESLADGTTVTIDDNYLRESVVNPMAKIVNGYAPAMPAFAGRIKDKELDALIDWIKSLE